MNPSFSEPIKKAFDFASDTTKQLLTLSTGIIALTITFSKDILVAVPFSAKVCLMISWIIYVFSLAFGLLALMALTGELQPPAPNEDAPLEDRLVRPGESPDVHWPSIWAKSIKVASGLQVATFLLATVFVVISGVLSTVNSGRMRAVPPPPASTAPNQK